MNHFDCSDGTKVTQATIKSNLLKAYKKHDDGTTYCRGCGGQAQGRAHIIAQTRCKELHHTEWIWQPWNWFKACHKCNSAFESYKGDDCAKLHNYKECLLVLLRYDKETYTKYVLNRVKLEHEKT